MTRAVLVCALLLAAPRLTAAQAPTRAAFKVSAAALASLEAADFAQTAACLHAHRCIEGNPITRPFTTNTAAFAAWKAGSAAAMILLARAAHRHGHPRAAWLSLAIVAGAQAVIVAHNARELHR